MKKDINRRDFLKALGLGTVATTGLLASCKKKSDDDDVRDDYTKQIEPPKGKMTYRQFPPNKDKVSILGYGMMRLPMKPLDEAAGNGEAPKETIDQEQVNKLVDYAMEHGVNYYDTSPVYTMGLSERSTGIALKRHPRESFYVATKLSNFSPAAQTREGAIEMYRNSFKELQVDYIDYYLLHAIGGGGVENLNQRYINNGMLDFLLEERKAGRIRNLGFSYHGEVAVFDEALKMHDKMKAEKGETLWDFVQIQLNYLDWNWASETSGDGDASYLYDELWKRKIPSVIMEPLRGGSLANLPNYIMKQLKEKEPEKSVASWAFRFAGTPEGVLTVLSGMTYMEHLKDNLLSYSPLKPLSAEENEFLLKIAGDVYNLENIPCTGCQYCMPCPFGLDIPGIFQYYNKCKNEATLPNNKQNEDYKKLRRQFLIGLDRKVPKLRQADHCIGCHACESHCPQSIRIAREMGKISQFVEELKRDVK